jgi:hypothetical protein
MLRRIWPEPGASADATANLLPSVRNHETADLLNTLYNSYPKKVWEKN